MSQQIEALLQRFKKEFTKTRAGEIVWLRGILPGEIDNFFTSELTTLISAVQETEKKRMIDILELRATKEAKKYGDTERYYEILACISDLTQKAPNAK